MITDDELEEVAARLAQIHERLRMLMQVCGDDHMSELVETMPFCPGENMMHLLISVLATRTTDDWSAFPGIDEDILVALVKALLPLQLARIVTLTKFNDAAKRTVFGIHEEVLH